MKKLMILVMAVASITLYQNCSGTHEVFDNNTTGSITSTRFEDVDLQKSQVAFERTVYPLTQQAGSCVECHGVDQQPLHSTTDPVFSHDVWISFGLVDLRAPDQSLAVEVMQRHIQNNRGTINAQTETDLLAAIQAWSDELVANGGLLGVGDGVQPTFTSIFTNILETKCISCHAAGEIAESIDYTDYVNTINTGQVVAGNALASGMYTHTLSGAEPRSGEALTQEEQQAIADWINRGALNN